MWAKLLSARIKLSKVIRTIPRRFSDLASTLLLHNVIKKTYRGLSQKKNMARKSVFEVFEMSRKMLLAMTVLAFFVGTGIMSVVMAIS
jgi:hypothetical protein